MDVSTYSTPEIISVGEFKRGREYTNWRANGTNDWLLIFTANGGGRVASGHSEVVARRGTVTLYQPHTPHNYYTDPIVGRWHLLYSHFQPRFHWRAWLNWPEQTKGLRTLVLQGPTLIRNVSSALIDAARLSEELSWNALERAILWINSANLHRDLDERIRKATHLLGEKMKEPFCMEALAKECGISVSRLAHLFRTQVNTSPQKYHEQLRLRWARQLLYSGGLTVTETAAELGYSSPFYFSKRFKAFYGKSPSYYRLNQK